MVRREERLTMAQSTGRAGGWRRLSMGVVLTGLVGLGLAAAPAPVQAAPAAGAHGGHHGPPPINWLKPADKSVGRPPPFAASLINFVGLLIVLGIMMRKPLADMVSGRYAQITRDLEESAQRRAEAEAKLKAYEARLAGLDEERRRILADIRAEGEAEKARLIAEAKEQAARLKAETDFLISQEMKQLRLDLERQLVELTMTTAETALKVSVDEQQHRRLVDEFIAELGTAPVRAGAGGPKAEAAS